MRLILLKLGLLAVAGLLFSGRTFVSGGCRLGAGYRLGARHVATGHAQNMRVSRKATIEEMEEALVPKEDLWKISEDGQTLREIYPGVRSPLTVFGSSVLSSASMAFLIVGISIGLKADIVDWTPVTQFLFGFLRQPPHSDWWPQGVAMSFYGFFGFFMVAPFQWYNIILNKGRGVAEFNKTTNRFAQVIDNELIIDIDLDDIETVRLEFSNLLGGKREVYITLKNGKSVYFMDQKRDQFPRRILERRAAILSDWLNKDLEVDYF